MKRALPLMLLALSLFSASHALAWGNEGHRIVGQIAWENLTPEVRAEVQKLMPDANYNTLAETSTWADTYARNDDSYNWAKPFHYVNVDPKARKFRWKDCTYKKKDPELLRAKPDHVDCVVDAIEHYAHILGTPSTTRDEKVEALRFLAHFVGDLHQPLHVSHPDNRGGNRTLVSFQGETVKLHRFWDSTMIETSLQSMKAPRGIPKKHLWIHMASVLSHDITAEKKKTWTQSLQPSDWATESVQIAQKHAHWVQKGNDPIPLTHKDYRTLRPIYEKRLQKAGIRLAALLNLVLSPPNLPFPKP